MSKAVNWKKNWLIVLFEKSNFDKKLESHPLNTFKKTYGCVIIEAFHGSEEQITKLCVELQLHEASLPPNSRSVLMQIDKEGIVVWKD